MSRAALAFAAGLGNGYINEDRYQDRQGLLDREMALRESEYQTRKSIADEQLRRIQDEGKLKTALADATKQAEVKQSTTLDTGDGAKVYDMPAGVDSKDVASSDARQFKRNAEAVGAEVAAPKIDSATTVNGKAYGDYAAGLRAAQEFNDPGAQSLRIANALRAAGRPDSAMEYQERAEKYRQAMYDAQRQALFQRGAEMIAKGDVQGLLDAYNNHYNDGRTAALSGDGKSIVQRDKDGSQVGAIPFKSKDDLLLAFRDIVYPDKRADSVSAARSDAAKEAGKIHIIPMGGVAANANGLRIDNTNGMVPALNADGTPVMGEDGRPVLVKGSSAGGRVDHFEPKQWDAASKIDKSVVSFVDPIMGKEIENGSLRSSYLQAFNAAKASGAMTPNEAVEFATTSTTKLKELAQEQVNRARAADKSSKLTVEQAVSAIAQSEAWKQRVVSGLPAPVQRPATASPQGLAQTKVSPEEQRRRDSDVALALAPELKKALSRQANGDPRAAADVEAIRKEIKRLGLDESRLLSMRTIAEDPGHGPATAPPPRATVAPTGAQPQSAAATTTAPARMVPTVGEQQLEERARKAGYTPSIGNDGRVWFSRVVNGQGENLTGRQVADRLGLVY